MADKTVAEEQCLRYRVNTKQIRLIRRQWEPMAAQPIPELAD